jgi:hypothetical protein
MGGVTWQDRDRLGLRQHGPRTHHPGEPWRPGERVDVFINASEVRIWAFHCHILTHAVGDHGMFRMVTALVVP